MEWCHFCMYYTLRIKKEADRENYIYCCYKQTSFAQCIETSKTI